MSNNIVYYLEKKSVISSDHFSEIVDSEIRNGIRFIYETV